MIGTCQKSLVNVSRRQRRHKAWTAKAWTAKLLSGQDQRKLALTDAKSETFGKSRGWLLPVGGDEFCKRGEQTCLGQAIAIHALDPGFQPGLVQISERHSLLFAVGSLPL